MCIIRVISYTHPQNNYARCCKYSSGVTPTIAICRVPTGSYGIERIIFPSRGLLVRQLFIYGVPTSRDGPVTDLATLCLAPFGQFWSLFHSTPSTNQRIPSLRSADVPLGWSSRKLTQKISCATVDCYTCRSRFSTSCLTLGGIFDLCPCTIWLVHW